ncbi:hypothetical protein SAMN06297251_101428 [Fulvimarina manganoxydans]|uniref:UDP-2,3-diacylglucosamine pyrophosphatase LpxI n=1 Tax=Fulvimarina manganoxydans TaxID=937218 RepID=A0A1W1YKP9_9HYPH|nr:UDP-2,3-diacylglucosamine diphosphatase LpxI [Fulvimarina manganoxydans]MEE2950523.1 UDP-2,3-diacylglucosamine diphosphatase LpxI [Pseudomonadota bacterium]SMC36810.1 hypothetical protein SAMN06297251_101428 [Fulvimarina manganoxydans]
MGEGTGERLGILAGGGSLPCVVARAALEEGYQPIFARFGDGTGGSQDGFGEGRDFAWGEAGNAIMWLREMQVRRVVFCGTISRRPDFKALIPSWQTLKRLPAALSIVRGGDDRLLRNLAAYLERQGFTLLPVQAVAPQLLTPGGTLSARKPETLELSALTSARDAAIALGRLDAGQAVVASNERIIALEGIEGTREMMRRVADLRARGRIHRGERLALVKAVKPDQDHRFDLPSIGLRTIDEAVEAGISAIGLSAGASLVLDYDDVVAAADRAMIALVGLSSAEGTAKAMGDAP